MRDISAQYRQSALGVLWALIIPLANTAVWLFLTGTALGREIPLATTGWTGTLMRLNPLTPLILNARAWFTGQPPQLLGEWALTVGGSAMPIPIERMTV